MKTLKSCLCRFKIGWLLLCNREIPVEEYTVITSQFNQMKNGWNSNISIKLRMDEVLIFSVNSGEDEIQIFL